MLENNKIIFSMFCGGANNAYPTKDINFDDLIKIIKSDKFKSIQEQCMQLKDKENKEGDLTKKKKLKNQRRELKAKNLDYVTVAASFKYRNRQKENILSVTGKAAIDIDNIKNLQEVKKQLQKDPYIELLFHSISGDLKAIINIDKTEEPELFSERVDNFYGYLSQKYDINGKLDSATKDITRACFLSYDPNLYYNANYEIFNLKFEKKHKHIKEDNKEKDNSRSAKEMKEVVKLIYAGKNKEEIYKHMMVFSRWSESNYQYKDKTYLKALEWVTKNPKKTNNLILPIDNYQQNAESFYENQPFFYDENKLFWLWNFELNKYQITDDVELRRLLDKKLGFKGQTIDSKIKAAYLEALKWVGREKKPKDAKLKWVQFKNRAYSIFSGKIHKVTPDYFFTNPIPWDLGESTETPQIDKLFNDWVGEKYVKTLYEIIAYCCYREYPIHRLFCLVGSGRNGKSQFQRMLDIFIGSENCCSTELDDLMNSRFEQFDLYMKLVCSMGETNFGTMTRTSRLKKLSGQDKVKFEKKGVQGFSDFNYSKLIINSNSLPSSLDTSDGFYRRWLIIDFPNEFPEGKDIIKSIPEWEYNNLARKCMEILPKLLETGKFTNEGSIEERKQRYIENSNPWHTFKEKYCIEDGFCYIEYGKLYTYYKQYLINGKKRSVSKKEFRNALEDDGFYIERTSKYIEGESKSSNWVNGIKIDEKNVKCNKIQFDLQCNGNQSDTLTFLHKKHTKEPKISEEQVE